MKKTLTVNLGGIVFNIDEDAYAVLKSYLDTIKGYFDTSEGRDEIMTDIESRIAEMLQEKLNGGKQVINSIDINEIIVIMGQPEDYITEDMDEEPKQTYTRSHSEPYTTSKRRLYRDTDGSVVGGVCSGVGYYFGIDPLWIRLGFVISVLFFGTGPLLYIILWIIMPEARTPSEKLAMKGEPVTFDNIGKTVEDEIKNVKKKLNNLDENQFRPQREKFHSTISQIADFFLSIFKFAIKAIGKILGFVFILAGIVVVLSLMFGPLIPLNVMFIDPFEFTQIMFPSGSDFWMAAIGGFLFIGIPFIALILAGFILLFNAKMPKYTGLALAGAWVLGIVLAAIGGVSTGFDFAKESTVSNVINLRETPSDTIYFEVLDSRNLISKADKGRAVRDFFDVRDGVLTSESVGVDVVGTKTKYAELEIVKTAHGNTYKAADSRASGIQYGVRMDSNIIKIDPYFIITSDDKWRNQEVKVNLFLPVGKTIFIPRQFRFLLDDVKNYTDTYDGNMVNKYWTMTDSGLVNPGLIEKEMRLNWEDSDSNNSFHLEANDEGLDIKIVEDGEEHTITIGS
jgi:phage shock protein PspC (stress-responsive transcriptional regulator)